MLKFPCLVLDHDDTVVQTMRTLSYPFWCLELEQFRPGKFMSRSDFVMQCYHLGFADMCRKWYGFSEQELEDEYKGWQEYIKTHIPAPFPGIEQIIRRQKEEGGLVCVVSMSGTENILRDYRVHFGMVPDAIYSWDLPEHLRKPSPYPLQHIMESYHLSPHQLLVIDDMKPGADMAKSAGVPMGFAAWSRLEYPKIMEQMKQISNFTFRNTQELEKFLFREE